MALTASFSPDGKKILSVSFNDKAIHIWDVSSGSELLKIQESCFFATFSPDGREIVTDSLSFYDSETGEKTMNLNIKGVEYVTFRPAPTPGFRWVIAGLDDGSIFIRKTVSEDAPIEFLVFQRCNLAIYSPDSNFIAADTLGTYSIRVWDIRSEKPPISLIGHLDKRTLFKKYIEEIVLFPSYIETFGLPLLEAKKMKSNIFAI